MAVAVAEKRRDSLGSAKVREALVGYAFVVLPLAFFFLFFLFPMVYAIYISRYDWGVLGPIDSVGFQNYRDLYEDSLFRRSLRNILVYTVFVVTCEFDPMPDEASAEIARQVADRLRSKRPDGRDDVSTLPKKCPTR